MSSVTKAPAADPSAQPAMAVRAVGAIQERMIEADGTHLPALPTSIADCGVPTDILQGLVLKTAYTVPRFTTEWMVSQVALASPVVAELLEGLRKDHLLEVLGQAGPFTYQFAITDRGREHARRLFEISGYLGPAPVSLADYTEVLEWQFSHLPAVDPQEVRQALSELVLPPNVVELSGLAAQSRRSLFLFGPPGNGKTSLGHLIHDAVKGNLWIPHAIAVENSVIRVFDRECHQPQDQLTRVAQAQLDRRWVQVKRPFVVVGGELTIDALDLTYSDAHRFYEAPLHFKANGGTFLLDDFGCQRTTPTELLNRWIHPLERHVDFLTLRTGQQIQVPFRQMLVVSTNLDPEKVMTPAFLRRMGYRIHLDSPSDQQYAEIFHRYAESRALSCPAESLEWLMQKYRQTGRRPSSCEPRDLIERSRELCRFRGQPESLDTDVLETAWRGYFGEG